MIYSECLVCEKIYDKKPDGKKEISYSHGYCGKVCMKVSKELSKKKVKVKVNGNTNILSESQSRSNLS
jgi:hypothetical protein